MAMYKVDLPTYYMVIFNSYAAMPVYQRLVASRFETTPTRSRGIPTQQTRTATPLEKDPDVLYRSIRVALYQHLPSGQRSSH